MLRTILLIINILILELSLAQDALVNLEAESSKNEVPGSYAFSNSTIILSSALIAGGAIGLSLPSLKNLDNSIKLKVEKANPLPTTLDNYAQYFPALMVYGLNLYGIKGNHNFQDRSFIYISSQLISASIVTPTKHLVGRERPDGSNNKSFPSGHTATAFSTAHFMYREYRGRNNLLSWSGYPFAVFTGVYRILNNKHWMTDVLTGAGVGILSTELSYFLYPKINALIGHNNKKGRWLLMPYYQPTKFGLSYYVVF